MTSIVLRFHFNRLFPKWYILEKVFQVHLAIFGLVPKFEQHDHDSAQLFKKQKNSVENKEIRNDICWICTLLHWNCWPKTHPHCAHKPIWPCTLLTSWANMSEMEDSDWFIGGPVWTGTMPTFQMLMHSSILRFPIVFDVIFPPYAV